MSRLLTLSSASARDADGDGRLRPGEGVVIGAWLSNPGPLSHSRYPGLVIKSDRPEIEPQPEWGGTNWRYVLFAERSEWLEVSFIVPSDVAPGTVLHFEVAVWGGPFEASEPCCGLAAVSVSVSVQ